MEMTKSEVLEAAAAGYKEMADAGYCRAWQGVKPRDFNLVLEGGSYRAQFSAGVLDFFMDQGIFPRAVLGVSAGALCAVNYAAGMRGRSNFLNTKYCDDWRYYSLRSLAVSGDAFGVEFVFGRIIHEIHPFDFEALLQSPMRFFTVASDLDTGLGDHHELRDLEKDVEYLRASASVPLLSRIVHVDGKCLLDGGIADSVPIAFSQKLGAETGIAKQVLVLTQDAGYVKGSYKALRPMRALYSKYPNFIKAVIERHLVYNRVYAELAKLHERGEIFILRPQKPVTVAPMEKDCRKLYALYLEGYAEAERQLAALERYLAS